MYRSNEELFKHIFDEIIFLENETEKRYNDHLRDAIQCGD